VLTPIGGSEADRDTIKEMLRQTTGEIEILAGRSFRRTERATLTIDSNGLPFADVPDLQRGTIQGAEGAFEIRDPVDDQMTTVLQVASLREASPRTSQVGDALWAAGHLVAEASGSGRLSKDYVLHWLAEATDHDGLKTVLRRVMDPDQRFIIPVLATAIGGWWLQISRRLVWVTSKTPDDGRLVEPLRGALDGHASALCAVEPVLIVARMTQPSDWAMSTRIWPAYVDRPRDRPWPLLAKAIHGHGIPVMTIDRVSSREEIACQLLLLAYWHGYIGNDEPALANAVAMASHTGSSSQ